MDFGQRARHWARLFLTAVTAGFAHDPALANEHDMTIGKLLFKFTGQSTSQLLPYLREGTVVGFC